MNTTFDLTALITIILWINWIRVKLNFLNDKLDDLREDIINK